MRLKYIKIITITTIIMLTFTMIYGCGSSKRYGSGKDTVASFGDGTYQVLRNLNKTQNLYNNELYLAIQDEISNYEKHGSVVYFKGNLGYTILDTKSNVVRQYLDFQGYDSSNINIYKEFIKKDKKISLLSKFKDFSLEEQEIFNKMRKD